MGSRPLASTAAILLFLTGPAALPADNAAAPQTPPKQRSGDTADAARWIKQLDSPQFSARTEASQALEAAGKRALPALGEAALGDSREASLRAIDVLRKLFQASDEATKEAARQTLKKIADSDRPSAARRAKEVLEPKPNPQPPVLNALPMPAAQIQIQVHAAANGKTRQVRLQNGQKEIEVRENNRKVKIKEDPNGGIEMEVTETKDGKETTQKYSAKNRDELKKKHPAAHKLYEEHSQDGGGILIQGLQLQNVPPPIPLQAPPLPAARPQRQIAITQLRHARTMIESASKLLERAMPDADDAETLTKSAKELEDMAKKLSELETKLGGR